MRKLRPYLQLVRFPAVFTAVADIALGFLVTHGRPEPLREFALLIGASACLYLAGMAFNDIFDREIDARERPYRPIPSGRVALSHAVGLASTLVLAGLILAAGVGTQSLLIALLLTLCIFAYDGGLKATLLGPLAMGGCRFLDVMLGASAAGSAQTVWALPQVAVAAGIAVYIAGVTLFARHEAVESRRGSLAIAAAVLNVGLAWLLALMLLHSPGRDNTFAPTVMLAVTLVIVNRRIARALSAPAPERVQAAVRTMLLSLVILDATLILFYTERPAYALATLALLVPAVILGRWVFIT